MAVTPQPGSNYIITTGGTAVIAVPGGAAGGFIVNPADATDQGLGASEELYVSPISAPGSAPGAANNTAFVLYPGQRWDIIPGQTNQTFVNAASSGHKFSVVWWQ